MEIRIERVKAQQVQQLADISAKTFYDTFCAQNTKEDIKLFLDINFNINKLTDELQDENNHFFFACINNEIAGYLKLSTGEKPTELGNANAMEIGRIYVLKENLGTGTGKALMEFSVNYAKENNKDTIFLGVWEHNQRAINFYSRFGFEKFAEHIFMVGNDPQTDWLMKKELRNF